MSVVIIGGNDRMVYKYKEICEQYQCKAKVFTQMKGSFKSQIGNPDLLILFTGTTSHKMVLCASSLVDKDKIVRCHTSSSSALKNILHTYCTPCAK